MSGPFPVLPAGLNTSFEMLHDCSTADFLTSGFSCKKNFAAHALQTQSMIGPGDVAVFFLMLAASRNQALGQCEGPWALEMKLPILWDSSALFSSSIVKSPVCKPSTRLQQSSRYC